MIILLNMTDKIFETLIIVTLSDILVSVCCKWRYKCMVTLVVGNVFTGPTVEPE